MADVTTCMMELPRNSITSQNQPFSVCFLNDAVIRSGCNGCAQGDGVAHIAQFCYHGIAALIDGCKSLSSRSMVMAVARHPWPVARR